MTIRIDTIEPRWGLAVGNELVTLRGLLPERPDVWFGDRRGLVEAAFVDSSGVVPVTVVQVRTPASIPAAADVTVRALDAVGSPIAGKEARLLAAFRFVRMRLGVESDLTRIVRALLRELKRQVLENTTIAVSVEYPEDPDAVLSKIKEASLPSIVLSGPRLRENRDYSTNEAREQLVVGIGGPELRRLRPPFTVDLELGVTIASDRAAEMLNLQSALARFVRANRWLAMPRDAAVPDSGVVHWELDPVGELRSLVEGTDRTDLRAFSWGLLIRGFDLAEDELLDVGRQVERAAEVSIDPLAA